MNLMARAAILSTFTLTTVQLWAHSSPAPSPAPSPAASINLSPTVGVAPELVFFSAGNRPIDDRRRYVWTFGDGSGASGFYASHVYQIARAAATPH